MRSRKVISKPKNIILKKIDTTQNVEPNQILPTA